MKILNRLARKNPLFDRMAKETRTTNRRYDRFLSKVEQNIEVDRISVSQEIKDVDGIFSAVIREYDKKIAQSD